MIISLAPSLVAVLLALSTAVGQTPTATRTRTSGAKTTTTTTTTTIRTSTSSTKLRPVKPKEPHVSYFDLAARIDTTPSGGAGPISTDLVFGGGGGGGGDGTPGAMCDFDAQDCGDGQKCTVENLWVGTPRCRSLVNSPDQVGDFCSNLGNNDGDSCDVDGICLGGVCRLVDTDDTSCYISQTSHYYPSGIRLCEERCDPIINGVCPGDSHCTRTDSSQDGIFSCQATIGDLNDVGEACAQSCDCRGGAICLTASATNYCINGLTKCCVPLCDLGDNPDYCDDPTSCYPIYYSSAPPGYGHLGTCVLFFP